MKRIIALAFAAFAAFSGPAEAQTGCSFIVTGAVLTAGQWNNCFSQKQDALGYVPVNKAGDSMTGRLITAAPSGSTAGFNVVPGSVPPSPVDGDVWVTTSGFFARINGVTIGPMGGASAASFAATAPLAVSFPAGVTTYALNFDSNFANVAGNLAFASIASGSLLANSTAGSAAPTASTPTAWLDRWCSAVNDTVPYRTGGAWGCLGLLGTAHSWTAAQTYSSGMFKLAGATSGTLTINAAATAGTNTITFPAGTTNFSATGGTNQFVKQNSAGGAFTVATISCADLSDESAFCAGTGAANLTGQVAVANGGTACSVASGTCLDNITGFSSTALIARTASGTYAFRTITGTSNQIDVTNGSGVSGNPTLVLATALTFTGKTVTGGTFTSTALNGTTDIQQAITWSGDISPTALAGNVDNYDPTGQSTASIYRINGGAANRDITGLVGGSDGRKITIINVGTSNNLVLKNDTTSTAANRFLFGADITLAPNQSAELWYDATSLRWRAAATFTVAGGSPAGTVTSITAGGGMTGGTITTSGTMSLRKPSIQYLTAGTNATYTTAANVAYLKVSGCGGGGGGEGSGTGTSGGAGSAGGNTCFGTNATACTTPLFQANAGQPGGAVDFAAGVGGTATGGDLNIDGGTGGLPQSNTFVVGGGGGGNFIKGAPTSGQPVVANSGFGGSGGTAGGVSATTGAGGGGGGCFVAYVGTPAASYTYTIGAGGAGGAAGTSGGVGVAGGSGFIIVEEF